MRTRIAAAVLAVLVLASCKKEEKGASPPPPSTEEPAPKADVPTPKADVEPTPAAEPAATAPATALGDSVTIQTTVPKVGATWTEEQVQTMDLQIDAGGNKVPMTGLKTEKKQIEVLAVSADAVTKARIAYDVSEEETLAGKTRPSPTPHDDKTYVLDATGGKLVVTVDGGGAPSAEEIAAIEDAEKRFGKPDKMSTLLAGKTLEKGKTVELPADQIADLMGDAEKMKVTKLTVTYSGASGADPIFDMVMAMTGENDGMKITIEVSGKATVDLATGELLEMTLEGPIAMSGKAKATGTMKMTGTRSRVR